MYLLSLIQILISELFSLNVFNKIQNVASDFKKGLHSIFCILVYLSKSVRKSSSVANFLYEIAVSFIICMFSTDLLNLELLKDSSLFNATSIP